MADEGGVWRTISGRRVFIKDGQSLTDAMRESGKFGDDKTKLFNRSDFSTAKKLTEEICSEQDFIYFGLRVQEEDTEKIGETMKHTSQNFGGDFDDAGTEPEELAGVSTIRIDRTSQVMQYGGYEGRVMYLLGADEGEDGYDPGEFIMKDARVLAKMKVENGALKITEKVKSEDSKVSSAKTSDRPSASSSTYAGTATQVKEYHSFKAEMERKYGDRIWSDMTDSEYDRYERLERIAYRGK